jgi:hypothetical protein
MSKFAKVLATAALIAGAIAVSSPAQARWHHGWHHGGGWGWGSGLALGFGAAADPYYYGGPYYGGSACGWRPIRVWRYGHWSIRRAWRCY